MYLSEHVDSLPSVDKRHVLWRRDDHGACAQNLFSLSASCHAIRSIPTIDDDELTETQLHIARPWRHVDDQHFQVPRRGCPVHVEQQLRGGGHQSRKEATVFRLGLACCTAFMTMSPRHTTGESLFALGAVVKMITWRQYRFPSTISHATTQDMITLPGREQNRRSIVKWLRRRIADGTKSQLSPGRQILRSLRISARSQGDHNLPLSIFPIALSLR